VGTVYGAVPCGDGRGNDPVRTQEIHEKAHGCDIRDGVKHADFVQMDFIYIHAVNPALCGGDRFIDSQNVRFYYVRDLKALDDAADLLHAVVLVPVAVRVPVVMMVLVFMLMFVLVYMLVFMFMLMLVHMLVFMFMLMPVHVLVFMFMPVPFRMNPGILLLPVDENLQLRPGDARFADLFGNDFHSLEVKIRCQIQKSLFILLIQKIIERSREHIAGDAHAAVQKQDFSIAVHAICPFCNE
jgi:hypothetical protein